MTGEELYGTYAVTQLTDNNCTVDEWDALNQEEKNVWDNMASGMVFKPKGPVIDLIHLSYESIHKAYVEAFGPLDPNITGSDIDWHIREIISAAGKAKSVVIVKDNGQIFAGFQKICDSDVATFVDLKDKHKGRIMVFEQGQEVDDIMERLSKFAYKVEVKNFVEV